MLHRRYVRTWIDHGRYRFDGFMARGSRSAFVALTVTFVALFAIISSLRVGVIAILNEPQIERGSGFWRQVYVTFLEISDPGSMAQDVDSSPAVKIFAILAGLAGIVLLSALIAFVTTALDQRMKRMRKGHSRVIETDHSLILGWNDRVVDIIRELIIANESEDTATVVVLADKDKEEMDDLLKLHLPERETTKVVTRSGSPSALVNLEVVSAETARSVIALAQAAPGDSSEDLDRSDMAVIKSVLAVRQTLHSDRAVPVVAEIFGPQKRELARSIDPAHVVCIDSEEVLAKILVQTSRSEGLAVVYEEMLSFAGAEMYFFADHRPGDAFADISMRMPDGIPMGILSDGRLTLNPDPEATVGEDDSLLVLASDDSAIEVRDEALVEPSQCDARPARRQLQTERELIVGWTPKIETIISEYGDYVRAGSTIDVVLRSPNADCDRLAAQLDREQRNIGVAVSSCDPFDIEQLRELDPKQYDNIIILSEAGSAGGMEWADAETLLILIQLQHILEDHPRPHPTLIAEVLDSKNRELVTQTGVSEFIISNRLISMLAAQMSEDARLFDVYSTLFSEDGSEVYLKPLSLYFDEIPASLCYGDLIAAAQRRGEVALGYRRIIDSNGIESNFGVRLIPPKVEYLEFDDSDCVIVLAEDET